MKTKMAMLKRLSLAAGAWVWCALNLDAQTAPTITTQPTNQTVLPGANVSFSVVVDGTGPFTCQWQFNGTNLPNNVISTVAGSGNYLLSPVDGGAATNGSLAPLGVALDAAGNLYIADETHNRIRWVNTNGIINTVAGNGNAGFAGDGGAATNASLYYPYCVILDAIGNLYIADSINGRIRKVDTNGIITTVAGGGPGGDGGAATNASLYYPFGVAFDSSGNLYIADGFNNRIRLVGTNGLITTVAGTGSQGYSGDGGAAIGAKLNHPQGLALDAAGNLYIADSGNNRIRQVTPGGIISTLAGKGSGSYTGDGGPATNATLNLPTGVALDGFGGLYIADNYNNRIRLVTTNGIITTLAGNGSGIYAGDGGAATNASLHDPQNVGWDAAGNLYIADAGNRRIRKVLLYASYPTLTLSDVGVSNAGNYTVVVTSPYGSVTSTVATLTVQAPPVITVQPASQPVVAGSNAILSVTIAGSGPLDYLWYFGSTNLVQSGGSSTLALSDFSTNDAGNYTVVVNNDWGSATSQVATLTLVFAPSVITQPVSQTIFAGTNVSLSVTAGGTGPFTYQWQSNGINLPTNIITTVAGNGGPSYAGDGGPATNASLLYPEGLTLDASGNLYIADSSNSRVRKVDTNGIITTVAGGGSGGDGGPATNASLCIASGVALDASGNLYIADANCGYIRKVDTNGIITTVAGCGSGGSISNGEVATNAVLGQPMGVAPDTSGNLYIACKMINLICKVDTNGIITYVAGTGTGMQGFSGDGGAATQAKLYYPSGVALDSVGNLYIADTYNQRVRKVGANGIITTVAGNGSGFPGQGTYGGDGGPATNAGLNRPSGLAFDGGGDLYIADSSNGRIRKVDTHGIITTVAGNGSQPFSPTPEDYAGDGGPATNASLGQPSGVALDGAGNLYISDTYNNRIREVHLAGYPTLALSDVGTNAAGNYAVVISSPYGSVTSAVATLTVQAPPVILVQPMTQGVLTGSNATLSVVATGNPPLSYGWWFDATNLIQSGTNSALAVQDFSTNDAGNYTVVVTNVYGCVTSQVAGLSVAFPPSVAAQPGSQSVLAGGSAAFSVVAGGTGPFAYQWQLDGTNVPNLISTVAGNGSATNTGDGGAATNAGLNTPYGVAMDAFGNLFIADSGNHRIRKVDPNGTITTAAGNGSATFAGDAGAATNASVNYPTGVAVDALGNLYVADTHNERIRKVDTTGVIITMAGNGSLGYSGDGGAATNASLYYPGGVALDASGNLYLADNNNRIRQVDTHGIISTVVGNGSVAYSGDGGPAANAGLDYPYGVSVDALGNLYIPDCFNQRVRKVDTSGMITTVAGNGNRAFAGDGGAATNASFAYPYSVASDAAGNMYIGDQGNDRIRKVDHNGIITTVAGNGTAAFAGDGGAASSASLYYPSGVALDSAGALYIADRNNQRIRKVNLSAEYPTLRLPNAGTNNAGNYTVVVTSPYGSVTSLVATLTVLVPPQIITTDGFFGVVGNQLGFNVSAAAGETIVVDGSTDLVNWTPLCTNAVSANPFYFCDPCWTNFPWRFYRARLP